MRYRGRTHIKISVDRQFTPDPQGVDGKSGCAVTAI
jgi:hypothetical protein